MEQISQGKIEAEIAELTEQIEARRRVLESKNGIVEDKDSVRQAVAEKISEITPQFNATKTQTIKNDNKTSYLDSADEETSEIVNGLLEVVFSKGIEVAVKEAEKQEPYIMDAFHDALTDKMFEELKNRKIIS